MIPPPHRVRQIAGHQESCNPMKTETMEAISSAGVKASVAGGIAAVFGGLTAADLAAYVGAIVAILGVLVNSYYKHKADKRHALENQRRDAERSLRMELMRTSGVPIFHHDTDLGELGVDE